MKQPSTFDVAGCERAVIDALTDIGVEFGSPLATTTVLLRLRVQATRTRAVLRDDSGRVVVVAVLRDGIDIVDHPDAVGPSATLEIHGVAGHASHAARVRDVVRSVGAQECGAVTQTLCAAAAGVDPASFQAPATVRLDASMDADDGVRTVLANLAETITANWQGTIDRTDPEFLHELRIAVRRTRVVIDNAKQVLPVALRAYHRSEFAWLTGLTGAPRDLDVYVLEWSKYTEPLSPDVVALLEPVRELLERRRDEAHAELALGFCSERAAMLMESWRTWLAEPTGNDELPTGAHRPLGRLVAKRITRAHDVLLERGRSIEPDTPAEQVHSLRKDAKKLRYVLECFGGLLPTRARKKYVKRLEALQDNLGEHQDAEVHIHLLRDVAAELHAAGADVDTIVAIGQLVELLDQQRRAARIEFAQRFAEYDTSATQRVLDAMLDGMSPRPTSSKSGARG